MITETVARRRWDLASPLRRLAGRLVRSDRVVLACCIALGVLVILAVAGSSLAPYDPDAVDLSSAYQSPSLAHPLGTDASGRDLLSRMMDATRISLAGPLLVAVFATLLGTGLAVAATWRGGWFDTASARGIDTMFAFPGLLLAIVAVAVFGRGFIAPVIALAIANIPWVARIVRSAALRERNMPYVASLTLQGVSTWRICVQHIVPNLWRTIFVQGALTFSYAMVDLAAINFLGLGVQPPQSDWGVMVASGQASILRGHPEETLFASAFIVVAVVSVNVLSQRMGGAEALEPR